MQKRGMAVILERTDEAFRAEPDRDAAVGVAKRAKLRVSVVKRRPLATIE
jgi:hypothetical protein